MGICGTPTTSKQVIVAGLDGAGKTTFLYSYVIYNLKEFQPDTTVGLEWFNEGFNYEVIKEKDEYIGFWDLGGKDSVEY